MKRFGVCVVAAFFVFTTAGCTGGGIAEGIQKDDSEAAKTGQPAGFEDMMKNMGKNMTNTKKRPPASTTK